MKIVQRFALASLLFTLLVPVVACEGDGSDAATDVASSADVPAVEDPHAEALADACSHFQTGPFVAAAATADATGAPVLTPEHQIANVTLVGVTGGQGGVLALTVAEAGDHLLALSKDVSFVVKDASGAVVAPEEELTEEACDAVAGAFVIELAVGSYTIELGPTTEATLDLYIVGFASEHHHEHEGE